MVTRVLISKKTIRKGNCDIVGVDLGDYVILDLSVADSTNVARHFKEREDKCPKQMSDRIDAVQPPIRFEIKQRELDI